MKDGLELLSIRATTDGHRRMQFTVDRATGESTIDMHELTRMDALILSRTIEGGAPRIGRRRKGGGSVGDGGSSDTRT